jgi:hypothetical protein
MLFFKYANGSFGGGPFFVWQSEEGEVLRIAKRLPITGLSKAEMPGRVRERNVYADFRAAFMRHKGHINYHQRGHAEEFLVHDFPTCLGMAGNVIRAIISITWSPCIGGLDERASQNKGVIVGCYNKLIILAAKNPALQFDVSFKIPFGHFQGNGPGAAAYLNLNRISNNITFSYEPETG